MLKFIKKTIRFCQCSTSYNVVKISFQLTLRNSIASAPLLVHFSIPVCNKTSYAFSLLWASRNSWTFPNKRSYSRVQWKTNLEVPIRFSFKGLPSFLDKEKSTKCSCFSTGSFLSSLPELLELRVSLYH